ncbi:MAG: hypothetical protein JNJ59_05730 [Deltaproteobacteria bacterium]|jgi:hypothetical protein|nr:hypothetical protein [Deltaproteobacteria bacterium]
MSKTSDDGLRPHLSALVDGELEPLEAIALQQRVRQSPGLDSEYREIERLKLAVHLAGTRDRPPVGLGEVLEARCRAHFTTASERGGWRWMLPAGAMAAVALGATLLIVQTGQNDPTGASGETHLEAAARGVGVEAVAMSARDTSDRVLGRLVDFHRESSSPMVLADLTSSGALVAVERVPDSFIAPEGQRPQLMQVSYMGCNERVGGSTLAVLRADRVDLPQRIDNALDASGVYVDTIGGVQIRVSVSGDKIFILLSGEGQSRSVSPI